jgi:hypothetical protein
MCKLFIITKKESILIENAENLKGKISIGEFMIYFGDKIGVSKSEFVSYEFTDNEESE